MAAGKVPAFSDIGKATKGASSPVMYFGCGYQSISGHSAGPCGVSLQ